MTDRLKLVSIKSCRVPSNRRKPSRKNAEVMAEKEVDKLYILPKDSNESTFELDKSLPSLPLPTLDATLSKYVESVKPFVTSEELAKTVKIVKDFQTGVGRTLQGKLEKKAATSKNWVEQWWEEHAYLRIRTPLVPFCSMEAPSPGIPGWTTLGPEDQIRNGAMYLYGTIYNWRILREERLRPSQSADKKTAFCMSQYRRIYSSARIPDEEKDQLVSYFKTEREGLTPTHVIIICNGRLFRVNAVDADGIELSPPEWATVLKQIRNKAQLCPAENKVAILTCDERTAWSKNRKRLTAISGNNAESLKIVDSAIVHLVLASESPESESQVSNCNLFGGSGERWADKSTVFILYRNGHIGCVSDHSQFDGIASVTMSHFVRLIMTDQNGSWNGRLDVRPEVCHYEEVVFDVDDVLREEIERVRRNCIKNSLEVIMTRRTFSGCGKNDIKKSNLHPDAFIQMAIQLTYAKLHGKPAPCYESATTRAYHNGRTETVRSCTTQCLHWVAAMLDSNQSVKTRKDLLKVAVSEHERLMAEAKEGRGCDRHLFGLYCIAMELGLPVPEIFNDPAYYKSGGGGNFLLSTSLAGYTPLGGGVAAMVKDGYGVFYCINPTWIVMTVSTFRSSSVTDPNKFFETFCETISEMRDMYVNPIPSHL